MIWSAFIVGLFGSLHCVGMCGPIALALPFRSTNQWQTIGNILLYNSGRVLTYATLGIAIGFLGQTIAMAGMQIYVSIALGALLIIAAIFSINLESKFLKIGPVYRLNNWVKKRMAILLQQNKLQTLFGLGMLNGLLPCGLVYLAIVGAVGVGSALHGAAYMALFGAGTVPLLLLTAVFGQFIPLQWRGKIKKLMPVFLVLFALLFLYRGLQFEMPDTVRFWEVENSTPNCH
jgi:sulfite exporter TauE/SafE